MRKDKVLIRMPQAQEFFFPAVAVIHDYAMQMKAQISMRMKQELEPMVLELWREDQFFFAPLFPRLLLEKGDEGRNIPRSDWSCVIDMRYPDRAIEIGKTVGKHITDAWGFCMERVLDQSRSWDLWVCGYRKRKTGTFW